MTDAASPRILALGAVIAACLAASSPALADHGALSGDQIRAALVGSSITGLSSNGGRRWYADYATDGSYVLRVPERDWQTRGSWQIDGGLWCTERPQRSRRCVSIVHVTGDDYQTVDDRGEVMNFSVAR